MFDQLPHSESSIPSRGIPKSSRLEEEYNTSRQRVLADRISTIISRNAQGVRIGLDIGSQDGFLAELVGDQTDVRFVGIDIRPQRKPAVAKEVALVAANAASLPFRTGSFDLVVAVSVMEHIPPLLLTQFATEVKRVLRKGGLFVGQLPNMNFPIEPHSWLPFQQFVPRTIGAAYFRTCCQRKSSFPFGVDWYRFTKTQLQELMRAAGFAEGDIIGQNYPDTLFPAPFRRFYRYATPLLRRLPMNYDFFFIA